MRRRRRTRTRTRTQALNCLDTYVNDYHRHFLLHYPPPPAASSSPFEIKRSNVFLSFAFEFFLGFLFLPSFFLLLLLLLSHISGSFQCCCCCWSRQPFALLHSPRPTTFLSWTLTVSFYFISFSSFLLFIQAWKFPFYFPLTYYSLSPSFSFFISSVLPSISSVE